MTRNKILPPTWFLLSIVIMLALHFLLPVKKVIPSPYRYSGILLMIAGVLLNIWPDQLFKKSRVPWSRCWRPRGHAGVNVVANTATTAPAHGSCPIGDAQASKTARIFSAGLCVPHSHCAMTPPAPSSSARRTRPTAPRTSSTEPNESIC